MEKEKYLNIVNNNKAPETRFKNAIVAFLVGGVMGLIGQFLVSFYSSQFDISSKDAAVFMIVTLIFLACLFTALGFFDKLVNFAKCGLIIPITGFAHSMQSAALEYKNEGPIYGVGSNIFKLAGSVILYGVVSAWFFGLIRVLIGGA